ncbi:MAG TPA: VCBS repeat-containing protein [Terriglobales bacterium]|nr:VCBS repeat-containing protein [Terriglobales bacterium]
MPLLHRTALSVLALCGFYSYFVGAAYAQESYQTIRQLSVNAPSLQEPTNSTPPSLPLKFHGREWTKTSDLISPEQYETYFTRKNTLPDVQSVSSSIRVGTSISSQLNIPALTTLDPSQLPGFRLRDSLPAGFIPTAVVTGDFDRNLKTDFLIANGGNDTLWFYSGKGSGGFELPTIIPIHKGISPVAMVAADLLGRGITDIVVANADSNNLSIFFGAGDGTFAETSQSLPFSPQVLTVADFNRDGKLDVVVAGYANFANFLATLLGTGNGGFAPPIIGDAGSFPAEIANGDLNGDGFPDLVITYAISVYWVFLNNGNGSFSPQPYVLRAVPNDFLCGVALLDANRDGRLDLLITSTFGILSVYDGKGDGTFSHDYRSYGTGDVPWGITIGDVNADGISDVITTGVPSPIFTAAFGIGAPAGNLLSVLFGDGVGGFGPAAVYRGGLAAFSVATADFNGDGKIDVVTANQQDDSASVFLNDGNGRFGEPHGNWIGYTDGPIATPLSEFLPADVNGDLLPDLCLIEINRLPENFYQLTTLLNDGSGSFSAPVRSRVIDSSYLSFGDFVLADFRNTGKLDFLAIASSFTNRSFVSFAANAGGGHFESPVVTQPTRAQGVIGVGDFNRDGNLDFVAVSAGTGTFPGEVQAVQTFLGDGNGTFSPGPARPFGGNDLRHPVAAYVADYDHDAILDLMVQLNNNEGLTTSDTLYELRGNGDGSFRSAEVVFAHSGPTFLRDLNRDGTPDIIRLVADIDNAGFDSPQFNIYLNQLDGNFRLAASYASYQERQTIPRAPYTSFVGARFAPMVADFNGDSNPDIASFGLSASFPVTVSARFLMGNGDGTFTPTFTSLNFEKNYFPNLAFDVNGDGRADLIELDGYRSSFHVIPAKPGPSFQLSMIGNPVVGNAGLGQITLATPLINDASIALTVSDTSIMVPETVIIPAGEISQQFDIAIGPSFNRNSVFAITGQRGIETATAYGTHVNNGEAGFSFFFLTGPPSFPQLNLVDGQTSKQISMVLHSLGGYGSTLNVACKGLPVGVSCRVLPAEHVQLLPGLSSGFSFLVATSPGTTEGVYPAVLQVTDGVLTETVSFTLNVEKFQPDFKLSLEPTLLTMFPTAFADFKATASSVLGFDEDVTLSLAALPSGIACASCNLVVHPTTGGSQSLLRLSAQSAALGNYTIAVTGTSNLLSHTASAVLQVWDFGASVSPSTATIQPGSSASGTVAVNPMNGFTGIVSLSCFSPTTQIKCSFSPDVIWVNGVPVTSTVTISASQQVSGVTDSSKPTLHRYLSYGLLFLPVVVFLPSRRRRSRILLLSLCLGMLSLLSCGGGSRTADNANSGTGGPSVSNQSFTISVQAAAGNVTRNAGQIIVTIGSR